MQEMIDTTVLLFDLPIFSGSKQELLDLMYLRVKGGKSLLKVATPNPEQVIQAKKNQHFFNNVGNFDLLLPDGQGLVWASQLFAARGIASALTNRITGREVVSNLIHFAQQENLRVLIVGGRDYHGKSFGDAQVVLPKTLQTKADQFSLYWLPGYEDITAQTTQEQQNLEQSINELKPDIVFVAFGAPHQEAWVVNHQQLLEKAGVKLAMVVGGSFDYLLGKAPRVPQVLERIGLEWLFRLITQPWRWKRQLRLLSFIWLTFTMLLNNKKPTR